MLINYLNSLQIFTLIQKTFSPSTRNPETLGRLWAIPGTPGLEHRLGGLEKDAVTGEINYEPENHEKNGSAP